jgi:hypothetical protein
MPMSKRTSEMTVLGFGLALFVLVACDAPSRNDDSGDGSDSGDDGGDGFIDAAPFEPPTGIDAGPSAACNQIDFLFVIDNSGSMDDVQNKLIAAFPQFATLIDQYQNAVGQQLDYRIAVTTTGRDVSYNISLLGNNIPFNEMGDDGEFRAVPGQTRRWIERADGNVATTFSTVGKVGTGGPGLEMQLLSMEWALSRRMTEPGPMGQPPPNMGFLREDALLAIVMVSDEDDCSTPDNGFTISDDSCDSPEPSGFRTTQSFKDFLDGVKGAGRWAVAMIAIPPGNAQGCGVNDEYTAEGIRLKQFSDLAGVNGVFADLCAASYADALGDALDTFTAACENLPPVE